MQWKVISFFTSEILYCFFSAKANLKSLHFHLTQLTSNAFAQGCEVHELALP